MSEPITPKLFKFDEYDRSVCRALYDGHQWRIQEIARVLKVHPKYVFLAVSDLIGFKDGGK